jgi:hypothetical protein
MGYGAWLRCFGETIEDVVVRVQVGPSQQTLHVGYFT